MFNSNIFFSQINTCKTFLKLEVLRFCGCFIFLFFISHNDSYQVVTKHLVWYYLLTFLIEYFCEFTFYEFREFDNYSSRAKISDLSFLLSAISYWVHRRTDPFIGNGIKYFEFFFFLVKLSIVLLGTIGFLLFFFFFFSFHNYEKNIDSPLVSIILKLISVAITKVCFSKIW